MHRKSRSLYSWLKRKKKKKVLARKKEKEQIPKRMRTIVTGVRVFDPLVAGSCRGS